MIKVIVAISIGLIIGRLICRRSESEFRLWAKADSERDLMFRKLLELIDDPCMSDRKWAQWLPVFEYVDRSYAENNFLGVSAFSLAEIVRRQIDDDLYLRASR